MRGVFKKKLNKSEVFENTKVEVSRIRFRPIRILKGIVNFLVIIFVINVAIELSFDWLFNFAPTGTVIHFMSFIKNCCAIALTGWYSYVKIWPIIQRILK